MTDILNKIANYLENLALIPQYAEFFYSKYFEILEKGKGLFFIAIFIIIAVIILLIAILVNQSRLDHQIREIKRTMEQLAEDKKD